MDDKNIQTEAVEICPHCEGENIYPNYDVGVSGYIVKCKHCGKKIFLCDECIHSEDNVGGFCDWTQGESCHFCFRGKIEEKETENE